MVYRLLAMEHYVDGTVSLIGFWFYLLLKFVDHLIG